MAEPDYYQLIGVERSATLQEIRSNFRQKVLAEHPDKGGDPKKFQLLNKAYNVLTDQEKRRRYDSTGRAEKTAEEEFIEGFAGGRLHYDQRSKEADAKAVVNLQDRIISGPQAHDAGFTEWLRQRDQDSMVLTDKDFMRTHLYNAAELATQIEHDAPVLHVMGSPKMDANGQPLGGTVQAQVKARPLKKALDHDELLVRMLAVPVDETMIHSELSKSVCLGMTGVGKIEQVGARIEDFKPSDTVLVMPKPTKFSSERPLGTARTLMTCNEEDLIKIPSDMLEELAAEQICLTPTIVCAYILLESYGAKLKPGDSVLLNAAHVSASGSSLLQLCKLLKLKPLCLLALPGSPITLVRGEYGSKAAWQDLDTRSTGSATARAQYERISEWLVTMGAEEVFPDAASLLRWRDRNQRMLPKVALDGLCRKHSCEQLMHCLQPGHKDAQVVVYGFGKSQSIELSPPLLAAWGGSIVGFNIARWIHSSAGNIKKMMAVMENVTKLIRANKFTLDTVLYKVGEDSVSDAFSRAADAVDHAQVVMVFPTLHEELDRSSELQRQEKARTAAQEEAARKAKQEEDERDKLKTEWLSLLFTSQSVAAMSPEGPIPATAESGNKRTPSQLFVWIGDSPRNENALLQDLGCEATTAVLCLHWSEHASAEGMIDLDLKSPEILDGSWYRRTRADLENTDLDLLHDVELLSRSMVAAIDTKLGEYGLDWNKVILGGFGKGAGLALYAALLRIIPKRVPSIILFCPVLLFPSYLAEKMKDVEASPKSSMMKVFTIWGSRDVSTPSTYRQLLTQVLRKADKVHCTPDTLPDGDHIFDVKSQSILTSLIPLCMPR